MLDTNSEKHFLKSLWPYLLVVTVIFVVTVIIGWFVNPEISNNTIEELKETLAPLASLGPLALLIVIILNNTIKALFSIIFGIIGGLPSLFFIGFNGFTIGIFMSVLDRIHTFSRKPGTSWYNRDTVTSAINVSGAYSWHRIGEVYCRKKKPGENNIKAKSDIIC
jgi:uncharacterized membrane protein SpoIIM required for sporulation